MLTRVDIRNFKSWRRLQLDLGSITGLFGPNSSGKSSLLQFLLMLKQTKVQVDRSLALDFGDENALANLGSFQDVVFQHDIESRLNWSMNWSLPEPLRIYDLMSSPNDLLFAGEEMAVSAAVGLRNKQPETDYLKYQFASQDFSLTRREGRPSAYSLKTSGAQKRFRLVRNPGRVWDIPGPVKSYAFPDQAQAYYQNANILSEFEVEYERLIDSIYYLGPLRDYPRREYSWSGARPSDVGRRGEKVIDALLAAKSQDEQRNLGPRKRYMHFDEFIAHWLKELGLIHSFSVERLSERSNLYELRVRKESSSAEVLITDVGFGVSQVLPVLVLLYYVPKGSIVLLEQPEIHLHPAVQSSLADLIINAVHTRQIQVVVESHSEHLLRRIQRRVADETIEPESISLYFCNSSRGRSRISPLALSLFGEIENWPENFFGDEFGEIAAIRKEALKRRNSTDS